jgi:hypothetical protein
MRHPHENDALDHCSPEQIQTRWIRHMRRGEWEAAWRISDEELRRRMACATGPDASCPRHCQVIWDGTPLEAKRVLVRCYHGMGDTVQFIRFMPLLRRIAARTIVWAQPTLLPLLRTAAGIDLLLPLHDGEPDDVARDVDIELMELPHALRVTLDTLPCRVPYFDMRAEARTSAAPAVGIVWQSGDWDPRRSLPLALTRSLMGLDGIHWHILQRGPALASHLPVLPPGTLPEIHNILDEARALRALDLLISVDTLSAHLAGALAVPTWTLLPAAADWRWMEARDDTPWYPTMRLFRQAAPGDWDSVIERVADSLRELLNARVCACAVAGPASTPP